MALIRIFLPALLLVLPLACAADGVRITVSATVLKRATLDVHGQPDSLVLTAADVARGYVDAPASLSIEVGSNSPEGARVDFHPRSEIVRAVDAVALHLPAAQRGFSVQVLAPRYRVLLAPAVQPGVYPWPVRISVTPL